MKTIKEKRLEKKWSQTYLAQLSGVPQPTISQIENGTRQYP
ncbi:helix-turn-helix domain-containing protein, partial [Priestia megaterium]